MHFANLNQITVKENWNLIKTDSLSISWAFSPPLPASAVWALRLLTLAGSYNFHRALKWNLELNSTFLLHLRVRHDHKRLKHSAECFCSSELNIAGRMNAQCLCDHSRDKNIPFEVIIGHVKVFQCQQEVVKGLARDFDQLVVVDN